MGEWFVSYHPSGVMQKRASLIRPWLYQIEKARAIFSNQPADPRTELIVATSRDGFYKAVEGWTHFAFDIETPRNNTDTITTMSVSNGRRAVIVDLFQTPARLSWFQELFNREGKRIVQNGAFDIPILFKHGLTYDVSQTLDTMLAAYAIAPDERVSLTAIAAIYLDTYAWKYESDSNIIAYNGKDSANTYRLGERLAKRLKENGQWDYYLSDMMPLLWEVIIPLNITSIPTDQEEQRRQMAALIQNINEWKRSVETHFQALSNRYNRKIKLPFGEKDISHVKASKLLYDVLGFPLQRDPETGKPSTSKYAFETLSTEKRRCDPIYGCKEDCPGTPALLLQHSKLKSDRTAIGGLGKNPLRTRYVLGGDDKYETLSNKTSIDTEKSSAPTTGRLSSRDPNLQNVPDKPRRIVVPTEGNWLAERDWDQSEFRFNWYFSQDPALLDVINSGYPYLYIAWLTDYYTEHHKIAHLNWEELTGRYDDGDPRILKARKDQKSPTLGWLYRMGARKLQLVYHIPQKKGRAALEALNLTFPKVVEMWDRLVVTANRDGYLENPFGGRRYFWDPEHDVPKICNFPAQSTGAEIMKRALRRFMAEFRPPNRLLLTVHDQALAEGPDPVYLHTKMKEIMEHRWPQLGNIDLPTSGATGKNWGSYHETKNPNGMKKL